MVHWWESEQELQETAVHLAGADLAALARTCRSVRAHLQSRGTLRWLAALRGLADTAGISTLEHIELAEAVADLESSIAFRYGDTDLEPWTVPKIQRFAMLLKRHPSLTLSIEAHCGLEAPTRAFARGFTRRRAESVRETFIVSGVGAERMRIRAWGSSRPLVWARGEPAGSPNRRVELFISRGDFEVPKRRAFSEYAVPPGAPPLAEQDEQGEEPCSNIEEDSGSDSGGEVHMVILGLPQRQGWIVPAHLLQHLLNVGTNEDVAEAFVEDRQAQPLSG